MTKEITQLEKETETLKGRGKKPSVEQFRASKFLRFPLRHWAEKQRSLSFDAQTTLKCQPIHFV